jgi:hypothetical protein
MLPSSMSELANLQRTIRLTRNITAMLAVFELTDKSNLVCCSSAALAEDFIEQECSAFDSRCISPKTSNKSGTEVPVPAPYRAKNPGSRA